MGTDTGIEWTDATWNPVRGCTRVSAGCENCYAEKVAARFSGPGLPYDGLARIGKNGARWTGDVRMVPEHLADPLRWKRPRRVFVNSMSDLFHEGLANEQIAAIFGVMAATPNHAFQVLTKRAQRMWDWFQWMGRNDDPCAQMHLAIAPLLSEHTEPESYIQDEEPRVVLRNEAAMETLLDADWPLPNVWLGISAENQATADERIPLLLKTPAAVRWVSAEPLLGPIDLFGIDDDGGHGPGLRLKAVTMQTDYGTGTEHDVDAQPGLDWVVVGSESGPGARPMDIIWARSIVDQCLAAEVPVFTKQIATPFSRLKGDPKGGNPKWWPPGNWPREFPR